MRRREFLRGGTRAMTGGLLTLGGGVWSAEAGNAQAPAGKNKVILVWSEGTAPKSVYPKDINGAVAEALTRLRGYEVRTASINDPEQGLSDEALNAAHVLFWWGHERHGDIPDATVARVVRRVKEDGMGVVFLHSAHYAKPLKAVLGATGSWKDYVNDGKPEHISVADPKHPIARGVRPFTIPKEERYDEPFEVPTPEAAPFEALYEGNNARARQGLCWTVGKGRVFYFRPGHEEYPVYFMPEVRRILRNAALWAARDEVGIWEDADPSARAARAAGEPPLAVIAWDAGLAGTDIAAGSEVDAKRLVKAGPGLVTFTPLAAFGVPKVCRGGWYPAPQAAAGDAPAEPKRSELWKLDAAHNKQTRPPLAPGGSASFDPGDKPFGLWVGSEGFAGEYIYTEDALQARVKRFPANDRHKAHAYAAVRSDGTPVPSALLIGFEYSTNNDNQEVVALVENVRPHV